MRTFAKLLASFALILGAVGAVPSPANAADTGGWKEFTWTDSYGCYSRAEPNGVPDLKMWTCTVVNGVYAQAVVIFKNEATSGSVRIAARIKMNTPESWVETGVCGTSLLAAGTRRACFSPTRDIDCFQVTSYFTGRINTIEADPLAGPSRRSADPACS